MCKAKEEKTLSGTALGFIIGIPLILWYMAIAWLAFDFFWPWNAGEMSVGFRLIILGTLLAPSVLSLCIIADALGWSEE